MLEGGVEKSRVVVRRRRAALVRFPITRRERRLAVTETGDVIAQERHLVVPALSEAAEVPVLGGVIPRQMLQLLGREDHAAVTLLIVRAVWLLAGKLLKCLKCGDTPHVTQVCD